MLKNVSFICVSWFNRIAKLQPLLSLLNNWDFFLVLQVCPLFTFTKFLSDILPTSPAIPLPEDLFVEAESLNPCSLYSSEALRWRVIMSVLMILQPGEPSPRWQQSWILNLGKLGEVNVWGDLFFYLFISGSVKGFKKNKDEPDKQSRAAKLSGCYRSD